MFTCNARFRGIMAAMASACLFGASTPFVKAQSSGLSAAMMAGLLYLGSGLGLGGYLLLRRKIRSVPVHPKLARNDIPWLVLATLAGGVAGPILLMYGLAHSPASTTSLLLNMEGVLTALLAWFIFKENFDSRIVIGMGLISAGGICLTWTGTPEPGLPLGSLAVIGACLMWATDNNFTRKISGSDPVQIACFKGLASGLVNCTLALALGAKIPELSGIWRIGTIGLLGYGISLVLFVVALREVGAARAGAYFSLAPFIGATLSVTAFGEDWNAGLLMAAILMGAGLWLHLTERHEHAHRHEAMAHEHRHVHDEHHQHAHHGDEPPGEPHTHWHEHPMLIHSHPHYPEIHHRHRH